VAITTQGKMVAEGGKYAGLSIQEARKQVVQIWKRSNL
jgi:valyl-tRNA synthetase